MATIRKTTYRCDSCGKDVPSKADLVQLRVGKGTHSQQRWNDTVIGARADLCDECENTLLSKLTSFFGQPIYETLRRKPKREKKGAKAKAAPSS